MGFNAGSLLTEIFRDVIEGLTTSDVSLTDMISTKLLTDDINFSIPYFADTDSLARDEAATAVGSTVTYFDDEFQELVGKMRPYMKGWKVPKQVLRNLDKYLPALERNARRAKAFVDTSVDLALISIMADTALNNEKVIGTVWTDPASKPFDDFLSSFRTFNPEVQGPDGQLVIGRETADALVQHPDLKEQFSHYSGRGIIPKTQLAAVLSEKLEIPNVVVVNKFYNSADEGVASVLTQVAGAFCWAGVKRGLVTVEQEESGEGETDYDFDNKEHKISYDRMLVHKRPNKSLGIIYTGTV